MLPKLSYLPSGQINIFDNNAKLNAKIFNNTNNCSQADVFLVEINNNNNCNSTRNDNNTNNLPSEEFKDSNNNIKSFYFNLNEFEEDSDSSNRVNPSSSLAKARNIFILDKYSTKQKEYYQKSISNKSSFLYDKQSLGSSTSSLSSFSTSHSSVSPNFIEHPSALGSYPSEKSQVFVSNKSIHFDTSLQTPTSKKISIKSNNFFLKPNEKKEATLKYSSSLLVPSSFNLNKDITKKTLAASNENLMNSPDKTKLFTLNVDLLKQKSLLKKNNLPNKKATNENVVSPAQPLNLFEVDNSSNKTELNSLQAKLESSQLSLLSKEYLNGNDEAEKQSKSNSLSNLLIVSRHGTVRGSLNHVKTSLKQIFKEPQITNPVTNAHLNIATNGNQITSPNGTKANEKLNSHFYLARDYEEEEHMKIVIYTTSLQVVRMSFDKCKKVKKILQNHCVRYEEKDLYKHKEFQRELKYRLNLNQIDVPHVFFNGKHIGNCDELELYSDQGVLHKLFKDLEKIKLRIYCSKCGGYRFVLCTICNGSKRKFNNFTNLKCTHCNEDGLIRCDACLDQQE